MDELDSIHRYESFDDEKATRVTSLLSLGHEDAQQATIRLLVSTLIRSA